MYAHSQNIGKSMMLDLGSR